jgi:nucleoside-diphosphate-sugar epimerase
MSTYLVTGGAGFIGTNLVKRLLEEGHEVRILDNFCAGKFPDRIDDSAIYIEGDIRNYTDLLKAMKGVEGVFHTAAVPRVPYSIEFPLETNENNVTGTLQVLLAAKECGVKRVVYSASQSAYGNQPTMPLIETMSAHPLSPYALQKYIGEEYCRLFSELYGLETVSLRYFNVYGPFMSLEGAYALVIGKFLRQRRAGELLTICGDGEYYRDFTHVIDIVSANVLAMHSTQVGKGEVVNVGFGRSHSINYLAKLIGGEITYIPDRKGDIRRGEADNTKARELLDWEPTIDLDTGIKELKKIWNIE